MIARFGAVPCVLGDVEKDKLYASLLQSATSENQIGKIKKERRNVSNVQDVLTLDQGREWRSLLSLHVCISVHSCFVIRNALTIQPQTGSRGAILFMKPAATFLGFFLGFRRRASTGLLMTCRAMGSPGKISQVSQDPRHLNLGRSRRMRPTAWPWIRVVLTGAQGAAAQLCDSVAVVNPSRSAGDSKGCAVPRSCLSGCATQCSMSSTRCRYPRSA